MVLKCILRKKSKPLCSSYFTKPFCRNNFRFPGFFINHSVRPNHFGINELAFSQKTTNHFVDVFVDFRKESKPFCKANPNLWPNPKKTYKPISSVPLKKIRCFSFFLKKTKPCRKVVPHINPSVKISPPKKKLNHSAKPNLLVNYGLTFFKKTTNHFVDLFVVFSKTQNHSVRLNLYGNFLGTQHQATDKVYSLVYNFLGQNCMGTF